MADVKFWFSPGACSLAPHVLLHEIGVPFEAVTTNLFKGDQLTEAFARTLAQRASVVSAMIAEGIADQALKDDPATRSTEGSTS